MHQYWRGDVYGVFVLEHVVTSWLELPKGPRPRDADRGNARP